MSAPRAVLRGSHTIWCEKCGAPMPLESVDVHWATVTLRFRDDKGHDFNMMCEAPGRLIAGFRWVQVPWGAELEPETDAKS